MPESNPNGSGDGDRPWLTRTRLGVAQALSATAAGGVAWGFAQIIPLSQGFWAAITAVAVAQAGVSGLRNTARDQCLGAAMGSIFAGALTVCFGQHAMVFMAAVFLSISCCWLMNATGAARLAGITSTIVLLVPIQASLEAVILSRVGEVAIGSAVAFGVVWTFDVFASWSTAMRNPYRRAKPNGHRRL